jgi:hypothetical protein
VRKTLIALAATTGLLTFAPLATADAAVAPLHNPAQVVAAEGSAIHQAWCGPRCHYWRHRHWRHWYYHHY